jgi:hypothetical protein
MTLIENSGERVEKRRANHGTGQNASSRLLQYSSSGTRHQEVGVPEVLLGERRDYVLERRFGTFT